MVRPTKLSAELPTLTHYLGRDPVTVTSLTSNSTVDYAEGIDVFVPPSDASIALVQSATGCSTGATLGDTATAGNLLVLTWAVRASEATIATPTGYTAHPSGTIGHGGNALAMFYKIADGTETGFATSAGQSTFGLSEWSGVTTLDTSGETTGTTNPLAAAAVTPTAGNEALIIGAFAEARPGDAGQNASSSAPWTQLHEELCGGFSPLLYAVYQIVASATGSYTPTATSDVAGLNYGAQTLVFARATTPANAGPNATDGNDATYAGPATDFYLSLEEARRIIRSRVLIDSDTPGTHTITIYGANSPDFSDEVELDSTTFTV